MIRIHRSSVLIQMAGNTILRRTLVDSVLVALAAVYVLVRTCERKGRFHVVIEIRAHPLSFRMTYGAVLRISSGLMIRIDRRCVITQMTGNAILRGPLVNTILMAARAGNRCVASR